MTSARISLSRCRLLPTVAWVSACLASPALAANHGHREHDAHAHGHGTLDIVVEGETALIELRMPGVNVVGFEHAPKDDAEREAVRQALEPLRDGAAVFVPAPAADCAIEEAAAEISAVAPDDHHDDGGHHDGHHDEGHHDDGGHADGHHDDGEHHDGEHAEDHHDDGGHAEDEHAGHAADSGEEAHSELHATYRFRCGAPERLDRIETRVLEHLRDVEEIDVRVVTPTAQLATELHQGSTVVDLTP